MANKKLFFHASSEINDINAFLFENIPGKISK